MAQVQRRLQMRMEAQGRYFQSVLEKAQGLLTSQSLGLVEATRDELADLASDANAHCMSSPLPCLPMLSLPPQAGVLSTTEMLQATNDDKAVIARDLQSMYPVSEQLSPSFSFSQDSVWIGARSRPDNTEGAHTEPCLLTDDIFVNDATTTHGSGLIDDEVRHSLCANSKSELSWEHFSANAYENMPYLMW